MVKRTNIEEITHLLRPGYVAMNRGQNWYWFARKPKIMKYAPERWTMVRESPYNRLSLAMFSIKPVEDWTKSLIEIEE
jgi:hypothetical protein